MKLNKIIIIGALMTLPMASVFALTCPTSLDASNWTASNQVEDFSDYHLDNARMLTGLTASHGPITCQYLKRTLSANHYVTMTSSDSNTNYTADSNWGTNPSGAGIICNSSGSLSVSVEHCSWTESQKSYQHNHHPQTIAGDNLAGTNVTI